ncbi:MarR family winged helix-turn-helix transcriptional regulator [Dyella caseinilytica]|uniref:MarR family transcriptional regulator n=1 Tax=Dyella caseinilytica TaxID=1849581 RepID=A0ABX7H0N7_9GAMM|nr:MarR family transcriptional regulator [Dyella caseinilytica]QRN55452.1 MarR family transcriptional regulator [Dyella caseinilytica]GGA01809.1 MarR family transcriptional regulator [Dyella caseinilytica]
MADFASTEQRLAVTCHRYPDFPRRPATVVRLIKHIYKLVHDEANTVLKPYGINHPEYNLLMMLYGTASGTMSPSELADAAGEKSANITRLTNELCEKGLISRTASADDRRKLELSLTAQGLALIESFLPDICKLLFRETSELTVSEQVQFEKLLKKFLGGLAE